MSRRRRVSSGAISLVHQGQLASFVTFTRASSKTYFDSAGVMQTAATNVPANHFLQDGSLQNGYYHEGTRTNECEQSDDLANWTADGTGASVTASSVANSRLGEMWEIDEGTGTGTNVLESKQTDTGTVDGTPRTYSFYAKAGTADLFLITPKNGFYGTANFDNIVQVDLSSETITAINFSTYDSGSITDIGDGIYYCEFTYTPGSTGSGFRVFSIQCVGAAGSGGVDYTATGRTFFISKPQIEIGVSFASSYIPTGTGTSTVTRATDVATVDLTAVSFFNAVEGTIYIEATGQTDASRAFWELNDGTANNRISTKWNSSAAAIRLLSVDSASTVVNEGSESWDGSMIKIASSYKLNDYAIAVAGNAAEDDTTASVPTGLTTLQIGSSQADGDLFGIIPNLRYYPTRRPDSQLQDMTT